MPARAGIMTLLNHSIKVAVRILMVSGEKWWNSTSATLPLMPRSASANDGMAVRAAK